MNQTPSTLEHFERQPICGYLPNQIGNLRLAENRLGPIEDCFIQQ
jgi:hypothetical protein